MVGKVKALYFLLVTSYRLLEPPDLLASEPGCADVRRSQAAPTISGRIELGFERLGL